MRLIQVLNWQTTQFIQFVVRQINLDQTGRQVFGTQNGDGIVAQVQMCHILVAVSGVQR